MGKCLYPSDYLKDHTIQVEFQGVYHSLAAEYLFILQLNSCLWHLSLHQADELFHYDDT